MALITSERFNLVPDISPLTRQIGEALQSRAKIQREDELLAKQAEIAKGKKSVQMAGAQFIRVRGMKSFTQKRKEMAILGQNAAKRGESPQKFIDALNIQNEDEFNLYLTREITAASNAGKLLDQFSAEQSKIGVPVAASAGQREFDALIKNLSEKDRELAIRIKAGLDPRAVGSAVQTITDKDIAEDISKTESTIATGKEGGKLISQLKFKPQIEKAVVLARKSAQEKGEVLTDLARMNASLPGLNTVVDQLRDLALIATSTLGGRAFDAVVKESGFGATKGSTARAKFTAIVNNQVLPLLKPTFGAAFTETEGAALRATLGDINATPEEKMAQLDAFIAQKKRDIEAKELQLSPDQPESQIKLTPTGRTATNPQTGAKVQEMSDGSWSPI